MIRVSGGYKVQDHTFPTTPQISHTCFLWTFGRTQRMILCAKVIHLGRRSIRNFKGKEQSLLTQRMWPGSYVQQLKKRTLRVVTTTTYYKSSEYAHQLLFDRSSERFTFFFISFFFLDNVAAIILDTFLWEHHKERSSLLDML